MTKTALTPAQAAALVTLTAEGVLYGPGNGVSLPTARALVRAGHATIDLIPCAERKYLGDRTYYWTSWTLRPVGAELPALADRGYGCYERPTRLTPADFA